MEGAEVRREKGGNGVILLQSNNIFFERMKVKICGAILSHTSWAQLILGTLWLQSYVTTYSCAGP